MGNPRKGTPQYEAKLAANRLAKKKVRDAAFKKTPRAKNLVKESRKDLLATCKKTQNDLDAQVRQKNKHFRKAQAEEAKAKRLLKERDAAVRKAHEQGARANTAEKLWLEEAAAHKKVCKKLESSDKELQEWKVFWEVVQEHAWPKTLAWLRKLKAKGPPRAPDRCWGGGQ